MKGGFTTPYAWLSRAEAGVVGNTFVVLLPGSIGAVRDGMEMVIGTLPHLLKMMRAGGHDD
jgi:molybdopterin biosynthesis enzyme MoaB